MRNGMFAISGAALGILCKLLCDRIAARLLEKRGRELEESSLEKYMLFAIMAVCGAAIMLLTPISAELLYLFVLLMLAEMTAVIDAHSRLIPNDLILAMLAVRLLFGIPAILGMKGFPEFNWLWSVIGMVCCFAIFCLPALQSRKVGAGDIKLAAAMGFCLGLQNSLFAIVLMGLLVLAYTILQNRVPMLRFFKNMIPMGPFLSAGMLAVLLLEKLPMLSQSL